jgi:hypothetical protein
LIQPRREGERPIRQLAIRRELSRAGGRKMDQARISRHVGVELIFRFDRNGEREKLKHTTGSIDRQVVDDWSWPWRALPQQDRHVVCRSIGYGKIWPAISIEIAHDNRPRAFAREEVDGRTEMAGPIVQ